MGENQDSPRCSFCGRHQGQVKKMFAGSVSTAYICNYCILTCRATIESERGSSTPSATRTNGGTDSDSEG